MNSRIIVALDVNSLEKAESLVKPLTPHVFCFKVGLQLLTAVGAPKVIKFLHNLGVKVFLDGKFNDIPKAVASAAKEVSALGVKMFSVHCSAGQASVRAAVENRGNSLVFGVTILTSIGEEECKLIFGGRPKNKVIQFAQILAREKADGIICSPQEAISLQWLTSPNQLSIITTGIRPAWATPDYQARFATPTEAIEAKADYLIIGEPITQPPPEIGTPVEAAELINKEISEALKQPAVSKRM